MHVLLLRNLYTDPYRKTKMASDSEKIRQRMEKEWKGEIHHDLGYRHGVKVLKAIAHRNSGPE